MKYETLTFAIFIFFTDKYAQSCITKKVEIFKGDIYYIGLFSINISDNQPAFRKSDAFAKHVLLAQNAYYTNLYGYLMPFAYIAYEICDNQSFLKEVILSLLLDEEFNLPSGDFNGMSSRIAITYTHISSSLTKMLATLLMFQDTPIVSQLFENQIFKNKNDLVPFYFPIKEKLTTIYIMSIVKMYSSNHVIVALLTNEKHFKQIYYEVIEKLSNEKGSCYSVMMAYSRYYLDEVVMSIASEDKNKTTIIVIGKNKHQQRLIEVLVENKVFDKNIISYGLSNDFLNKDTYNWFSSSSSRNVTTRNIFKNWIITPLTEAYQIEFGSLVTFNKFYKNMSDDDMQSFQIDNDWRYLILVFKDDYTNFTSTVDFESIKFANNIFAEFLPITGHSPYEYIYVPYWPKFHDKITKEEIFIYNSRYAVDQLKELSCAKIKCNASSEPIFIKQSYGIWNYKKNWICQQCKKNYIQTKNNTNASCTLCPVFFISNANNTGCVDSNIEMYLSIRNPTTYIPISICVVAITMVLLTFVVFIKYSESTEIKASNKTLTTVQIAVFFVFFAVFPFIMIGKPSSVKCYIRAMIFGSAFNIVASILFAKSYKLLKIFNSDVRFTKGEIRRSKLMDALIIITFVISETVLSFAILITMPPKVIQQYRIESEEKAVFCNNNKHFVIHIIVTFVIFFISIVQCFRMRKLPSVFNEANEILYATLIADFMFALTLLLYYSRANEYDKDYVMLLMLSIMATSFYFLLFYKKMLLLFQPERMQRNAATIKKSKRLTDMRI